MWSHDWAPVIGILGLGMLGIIVLIVNMVLNHQKELARMQAPQNQNALAGEVADLKKQLSDVKELLTDIAINTPAKTSLQERVTDEHLRT